MSTKVRLFLALWTIFATVFIGNFLTKNYHAIGFYYPEWFSLWITTTLGTSNAEQVADLEIFLNYLIGLIAASITTFLIYAVDKKLR